MSEPRLVDREAAALETLERLAAERARAESDADRRFDRHKESDERAFHEALSRITTQGRAEIDATRTRYESVRGELVAKYEVELNQAQAEYDEARRQVAARTKSALRAAKKEHEETRWQILAVYEAGKDSAIKRNKELEKELAAAEETLRSIKEDAEKSIACCRRFIPREIDAAEPPNVPAGDGPIAQLQEHLRLADEQLVPLARLWLPRFLTLEQFIWPFFIVGLGAAYPLGMYFGWTLGPSIDAALVIALSVGFWFWLASIARRQVGRHYPPFHQTLAEADALVQQSRDWIKAAFERHKAEVEERREQETGKTDEKRAETVAEVELRSKQQSSEIEQKYPPLLADIASRRDEAIRLADERYPRKLTELEARLQTDTRLLVENYETRKASTRRTYDEAWAALVDRWRAGLAEIQATVTEVQEVCDRLFLDWHHVAPDRWQTPAGVPPAMRFGQFTVDLNQIPQGLSADERVRPVGPTRFTLPALLSFPAQGSMLLKLGEGGKPEAAQVLQAMMLRYLTSLPPGKVRFTIVDPVGLGEHYAAFMHLADYHELLVNSRIWTETPHIEQRLADLQAHMENVIQKYLRNEFDTIEEYNVHAGEVAEPFRVLVVANFPVNFNESAARRLLSIASSGARCGVYTLISVDPKQPLPSGCQVKDLEPYCVNFQWNDKGGGFQWKDPVFSRFPLQLDAPPDSDTFTRLLHKIGDRARDANRVEVPFEFIAPPLEEYWTSSTAGGIDVPLGRAGATKLQHLKLGRGTSQHVLIAGKTGSGKSTLLHALITNAALRYSPDELELYLIDFKKGVEFKVYATLELPHARVIAVESEREFGLSVLQRLDVELKVRGDRFRELGVQDLQGYRQVEGQPPMPRILLIVDEFQEFFVEDDKIAQDTSLLLDRLVRQGRAFGIHVHLGSQTLGGAFSLARSTLGQMAVRIALQCSEADAHLILSEDNSAARLLTRPGEAIYNDANGMVEGNNFFQVVWLSDEKREGYLRQLQALAREQHRAPAGQIVFEGNLPAIPSKNPLLGRLLSAPAWPEAPKADHAWLGEAIAIKDPTAAVFRPQSGANLLIVGQNDVAALGIMSTALVSLAAQHAPAGRAENGSGVRFYVLDGSPADSKNAGMLGSLSTVVPHPVQEVTWRELAAVIGELAAEVERRQTDATEAAVIYLLVYDLQRFRDLRKAEDDFGFSRYGEEKATPPSKLFANILREGPPVGVHTIVWCDSLNNLNRTFDRQALREFEIRVLFQMSANDSSTLIDSPVAGRLGPNRALFFSEEEGKLEKFRPYGLPSEEWLSFIRSQFQARQLPIDGNAHPTPEFTTPERIESAEA